MEQASESAKEISITFDTIFDLLRNEKSRAELQKLPETFFFDVVNYLVEKQGAIEHAALKQDIFAASEREKSRMQLENARRMLRELYERREKKIITMAIAKSHTGSALTDLSPMLKEEKELFSIVTDTLDRFRSGVMINVINGKNPSLISEMLHNPIMVGEPAKPDAKPQAKKETKLIRFLKPVPKFVGKELEVYGPFDAEDVASLPSEIADLLVSKGRAEGMEGM